MRVEHFVFFLLLIALSDVALQSQGLDPIQQPAVGVRVIRKPLADERGSGFVISVDNQTAYILTARHLFYSGKDPFRDDIQVTFALDPLNDHPAHWHVDFPNLDLAVLKVSMADLPDSVAKRLKDLPPIQVRPSGSALKLKEDIFLVGGKFQDWQVPKDTVTGLQDDIDRLDRFRFTGTGVRDGFSGSAILDSSDRLVGVHLGAVGSDDNYGRAQRIADAVLILSRNLVPMNKLDLGGAPGTAESYTEILNQALSRRTKRAEPAAGEVRTNPKDDSKYVWIPSGHHQMGCSPDDTECSEIEKPAHAVTISKGFWLAQTPTTQASYQRVTGTNPSGFHGPDLPVEQISYDEASSYCQTVGGRLPTEAEWEYAARAGSTTARYGALDTIAWYGRNSGHESHPVGTKQPNSWGLYDMLGNVWQWTADWYDENYYEKREATDPRGPATGFNRVLRGGSWFGDPRGVRASIRIGNGPGVRNGRFGVRCVCESFP